MTTFQNDYTVRTYYHKGVKLSTIFAGVLNKRAFSCKITAGEVRATDSIGKKRIVKCILFAAGSAAAALVAAALLSRFGAPRICPFYRLTGLDCPGCGNTRAAVALLHLRFAESLRYNYAYPLEFAYLAFVIVSAAKNYVLTGKASYKPRFPVVDYVLLGLVIAWWIVRNVLGV